MLASEVKRTLKDKSDKVVVLAPAGVIEELQSHGLSNIEDLSQLPKDQRGMTLEEHANFKINPNTKAIVLGLHKSFDFRKIAILSLYL